MWIGSSIKILGSEPIHKVLDPEQKILRKSTTNIYRLENTQISYMDVGEEGLFGGGRWGYNSEKFLLKF